MASTTMQAKGKYLGYQAADFSLPHAQYYQENVVPAPPLVMTALAQSPLPPGALPPLEQIAGLAKPGYTGFENGYTKEPDGSLRVAVLTPMPKVTPPMWDWWFGWHGCADDRYKLWHPKAHVSAAWQDGGQQTAYIGRVSMIEEYIGKDLAKANIQFLSPAALGISPVEKNQAVYICARLGYTKYPLDFGWLVHQVRAVEGGAEMRSRFFVGGPHIQLRIGGAVPQGLSKILQKAVRLPEQQAKDLLLHCSEEMHHLAAFLPDLYHAFHHKTT